MTPSIDIARPDRVSLVEAALLPTVELRFLQLQVEYAAMAPEESDHFSEHDRITRITLLEQLKNSVAALQYQEIHSFARAHAASRTATGTVEPEKLERSIAAQVGLACGTSPAEGRKRVRVARDLRQGHQHVGELFATGRLSERKTALITDATSHLDRHERAAVDKQLAAERIERLGIGRLKDLAGRFAAEVAPEKFLARCRAARTSRRVTIRPAGDGMADLTAHLPVEQAAACFAALCRAVNEAAVDPAPQIRGRGQIMADTLVERLTGQALAGDVNIEVQIVMPVEALVDPDHPMPAHIPGLGPLPADLAREIAERPGSRKRWRRLFTRRGHLVGGESRSRTFDGFLAKLIATRDGQRCREPYCDAPVRHTDHIDRWADGGPTTIGNGRGACVQHNLLRETPGWNIETLDGGLHGRPHTVQTTTPTGHRYTSTAPTLTSSSV